MVILTIYFSPKKSEKYFSVRPSEPKEIGMSYCKKIKIEEDFFLCTVQRIFIIFVGIPCLEFLLMLVDFSLSVHTHYTLWTKRRRGKTI